MNGLLLRYGQFKAGLPVVFGARAKGVCAMWVRTLKITFKNELMKNSIDTYLASKVDLTEGMMLS